MKQQLILGLALSLFSQLVVAAESVNENLQVAGNEKIYIENMRGQVEITVGDQVRVLGPGEAYYFECRQPHRFRNVGKDDAVIISASTPPTF